MGRHREARARRFFDHWRATSSGSALSPTSGSQDDRAPLGRHRRLLPTWNKVALGFVEGLNNKIRVFQRRAYGLRNEEYLRLKVLTCMLPALKQHPRGFSRNFVSQLDNGCTRHCLAIHHVSASHRYGHDGQRKRVENIPTAQQQKQPADLELG